MNLDSLKGRTILIGKEPGQGRLLLTIVGTGKTIALGSAGSVPNSVSRCKVAEGVAHCKIVVGMDGSMTITNMKPQNVTYVDGIEIVSKRITTSSQVALGMDRYQINVATLIQALGKITPPPPPPPLGIAHLEKIWDDYYAQTLEIARHRNTLALWTRVPMLFTMGSGALVALANNQDWPKEIFTLTTIMTIIGFVIMLYGFWKSYTDDSVKQSEAIKEDFEQHYVCPNHECRHFLGYKKYSLLKQDKACPYCKSKFKC